MKKGRWKYRKKREGRGKTEELASRVYLNISNN